MAPELELERDSEVGDPVGVELELGLEPVLDVKIEVEDFVKGTEEGLKECLMKDQVHIEFGMVWYGKSCWTG